MWGNLIKFNVREEGDFAVKKNRVRTPKNYDGTALTTRNFSDLLVNVFSDISSRYQEKPEVVLLAWQEVIGPQFAPMTQAVSFVNGVLLVKVKNSTLHSLLSRHDKHRLLAALQKRVPQADVQNIHFRIA